MRSCCKCSKKIHTKSLGNLCRSCLDDEKVEIKFSNWLIKGDLGISIGTTLRWKMRAKILDYYGNCCSICEINEWNGKPLTLILDHIDGNAANNNKNNLRFVCPNCDSQLDTYKSKNKNSARNHRKKYT